MGAFSRKTNGVKERCIVFPIFFRCELGNFHNLVNVFRFTKDFHPSGTVCDPSNLIFKTGR